MDIFLTPENPIRAVPQAEFFPDHGANVDSTNDDPFSRWDGGPFLTYPHRKNIVHMIPPALRYGDHQDDSTIPFTENNHPTPLDQQHRIFTTWFFIGLLAEFLGANRQENSNRGADNPEAETILREIYEYCVVTPAAVETRPGSPTETTTAADQNSSTNGVGSRRKKQRHYLTAKIIPHLLPTIISTVKLLPTQAARQSRVNYLARCLHLTAHYLANTVSKSFDPALLTAISGLGELLQVHLFYSISITKSFGPGIVPPPDVALGHDWKGNFLSSPRPDHQSQGQSLLPREEMVRRGGWCRSDLGRINSLYQRLFTVQYISLLDRHVTGRRGDHSGCDEVKCLSAQIDNRTYKLSHADEHSDGGCEEFEVDIEKVKTVLVEGDSWPILVFEAAEGTNSPQVGLGVKEFVKGVDEYVALSHVWADGLGNTRGNSLQACQIARLRKLISDVELAYHLANPTEPRPRYHLWIDTLCCPVASLHPQTNAISLTRMKSVYEQAAHVLVLDAALSAYDAAPLTAATVLLRCFASSIWMRRLWTLQEGVLARSLFFQFRDQPVHARSLMNMLQSAEDFRYKTLWMDLDNEWRRLNELQPETEKMDHLVVRDTYKHGMYRRIQGALDFRAVTYPSDEPICIATLLGLDLGRIIAASEGENRDDEEMRAEKRMCELWRMIAENDVGGIPARIVFIVDKPLKTEGFGWAPSSLLGKVDQGGGSAYKTLGFASKEWDKGAASKRDDGSGGGGAGGGYLTPYGLAVELPALVIEARPLMEGMGLHDWDGVLAAHEEDVVYFYHQEMETWYRMIDWHIAPGAPAGTTVRELKDYRGMTPPISGDTRPLCSTLDTGRIALLKSEDDDPHNAMLWLMIQMMDDGPVRPPAGSCVSDKPGRRARWIRRVIVARVQGPEVVALETMLKVAREVAAGGIDRTRGFLRAKKLTGSTATESGENATYQTAREGLRQRMKDAMSRAWEEEPGFAQAVGEIYGEGLGDVIWTSAPRYFPHERVAKATAVDQRWFID